MSYEDSDDRRRGGYRTNDGLDPSSTTDAYGEQDRGFDSGVGSRGGGLRRNDGLDPSSTSDAYGGDSGTGRHQQYSGGNTGYRSNDGLDPSNTTDAYGEQSSRRRDDEMSSRRTDPGFGTASKYDRSAGGQYDDPSYGERTSGGLGYDDTIGTNERTGGVNRGGDQETSQYTSGGLGANDTYGDEKETGGADTGRDHNYGMGSGRTASQERGGIFPTEPGRDDVRRDRDDTSGSSKQDSTAGKLMEKAGGMFKSNKLQERGEQKRREAGGYDDSSNY
ncbi:hypothetical protein H2198_005200 [Neophaeococcomyces mojaviensis]|uniref:Uncharacterized protein n=1 Tax=Neophaeococcomyces mojaviensis TaxID=3383035 RepID=A0ACC3A6L4_9EURO|nr:hypothetical protein H2198_005200 [Knufia sp. JES_112]